MVATVFVGVSDEETEERTPPPLRFTDWFLLFVLVSEECVRRVGRGGADGEECQATKLFRFHF